jgi:hypothetical protein
LLGAAAGELARIEGVIQIDARERLVRGQPL